MSLLLVSLSLDLLDRLVVLDVKFVLCGDFNCPGVITGLSLDDRITDVITRNGLIQHFNEPTHNDGNMLDLILTARTEANFISSQSVCSICFSDHHLLRCDILIRRPPPIINKYSYRRINSMNIDAFLSSMLQSKLFDEDLCVNVNEFADLIDSKVTRQLDVYAPLQTRSRRCGQNDSCWLSIKA